MNEKATKSRWGLLSAGLLLAVAVGGYFGAYFALMRPESHYMHIDGGGAIIQKTPEYRFGGNIAATFFKPAHSVDRRLRSKFWE